MSIHVAILTPPYDRMILDGSKRIESRFTKQAREPFGAAAPGERIYFKKSGGPFFATAVISRVLMVDQVTPKTMDELAKRYGKWIGAPASYWKTKRRDTRFATLIWLRDVQHSTLGPTYRKQSMRAWYVLDEDAAPDPPELPIEIELTAGSIRQRTVRLAKCLDRFPADAIGGAKQAQAGRPITLLIEGGPTIETDIDGQRKMLRHRGWGGWFDAQRVAPGDRLLIGPVGRRTYRVSIVRGRKT